MQDGMHFIQVELSEDCQNSLSPCICLKDGSIFLPEFAIFVVCEQFQRTQFLYLSNLLLDLLVQSSSLFDSQFFSLRYSLSLLLSLLDQLLLRSFIYCCYE